MATVATLLTLALGVQGQAGDKGAMVMGTAEKAEAWMGTVSKKPVNGLFTSTNDWTGAEADAILAEIDATPIDKLTDKEVGFIHKAMTPGLATPAKQRERKASMERLATHPDPRIAAGAKTALLSQVATREEADALKSELEGHVAAAGAAWNAAKRLGLDPMSYAAPLFEAAAGKGCRHPAYRKWFLETNKALAPARARKALRAEIDGLVDDTATAFMDSDKQAWLSELRLRRDIVTEKASEAP